MAGILNIVGIVLSLIQAASELIKTLEVAGFGNEKKNAVTAMLQAIFEGLKATGESGDIAWDTIAGIISKAIDTLVGYFNAVGVLKKI